MGHRTWPRQPEIGHWLTEDLPVSPQKTRQEKKIAEKHANGKLIVILFLLKCASLFGFLSSHSGNLILGLFFFYGDSSGSEAPPPKSPFRKVKIEEKGCKRRRRHTRARATPPTNRNNFFDFIYSPSMGFYNPTPCVLGPSLRRSGCRRMFGAFQGLPYWGGSL